MTDDAASAEESELTPGTPQQTGPASFASEIPTVSAGTVFELLADRYRRTALDYLENTDDGRASVSDLTAYVSQHAFPGNSPENVPTRLHHSTLPKVAEAGLCNYDPETETVEYIGHPLVEDCLDLVDGQ